MVVIERTQEVVSVMAGAALLLLSGALLIASFVRFFRSTGNFSAAASVLLDQVLLVLILVEIVHTVVLSLRAHTLVPEPFIIVGLVAAIRKLLFVLGNQQAVGTGVLGLYIAMVAVFVVALVAVQRFTVAPNRLPITASATATGTGSGTATGTGSGTATGTGSGTRPAGPGTRLS